jgi:very-short-patch-repair endonuclease
MKADKTNYWAYNKGLQPIANKLRHTMTRAEVVLWVELLRASQMMGYPFRRQRPVLRFVVDFMCKNLNLVIEVDGASHEWLGAPERDAWRQKLIEAAGFKVIRFKDDEVLTNLSRVRMLIEESIKEIEEAGGVVIPKRQPSPWPPPKRGNSRQGRERRN